MQARIVSPCCSAIVFHVNMKYLQYFEVRERNLVTVRINIFKMGIKNFILKSPAVLLLHRELDSGALQVVKDLKMRGSRINYLTNMSWQLFNPKTIKSENSTVVRMVMYLHFLRFLSESILITITDNFAAILLWCSFDEGRWPVRTLRLEAAKCDENDDMKDQSDTSSIRTTSRAWVFNQFNPHYMISSWILLNTMKWRFSLAIFLPLGIECWTSALWVIAGGNSFDLTEKWPVLIIDLQLLYKKVLNSKDFSYQVYHAKFNGFQENLKSFCSMASVWIESAAPISLRFPVEAYIHEKHNLTWRDNNTWVTGRVSEGICRHACSSHRQRIFWYFVGCAFLLSWLNFHFLFVFFYFELN